jgi:pimeloyl-ACP methyl ester carboxylesterase
MATTLSPPKVDTHVQLHVTDLNKRGEEGIPVVILHGLLGQGRNFRSWGAALHDRLTRPRRILIPDLRNHGSSGHADAMTYKDMAADVFALLEKEGIEKAIVVGHSMGGKVAAGESVSPLTHDVFCTLSSLMRTLPCVIVHVQRLGY